MIINKLKPQSSTILSQKDLTGYFENDKFRRNSCTASNDSYQSSPKPSEEDSQNEANTQNLEQQIQRLSSLINLQRTRTQSLNHELNAVTNSLHVETTLTQQLTQEKERLLQELHYIRKSFEALQIEKNKLYNDVVSLRNQNNRMRGILDINQDQINTLQNTNRKIIDELNFQREISADYKAENTMFKSQLKNIQGVFVALKQWVEEERERLGKQIKEVLGGKAESIQAGLFGLKQQIKGIQREQRQLIDHKDEMFSLVRKIELNFQSTRTQLNIAKSLSQSFDQPSASVFLVRQSQFRKTIQTQQSTIKSLSAELTVLKSQVMQLQDQIKESTHVQLLAPRFHTNTGYVNKLVKQNHREILQIKQIIQSKDQQIHRIKQLLQLQKSSSISKSEQIERLTIILRTQQSNKYQQLDGEIEDLKNEKIRLNRRIEQLNEKISTMKTQIIDKDRIIVNYVQKTQNKSQ